MSHKFKKNLNYYDYCKVIHVKETFQKKCKNKNRNYTFFVFTLLFDQFKRFLFFKNIQLIKFSFICLHSEFNKIFSAKKCLYLKVNLPEPVLG